MAAHGVTCYDGEMGNSAMMDDMTWITLLEKIPSDGMECKWVGGDGVLNCLGARDGRQNVGPAKSANTAF